jgi:hypothetical protein
MDKNRNYITRHCKPIEFDRVGGCLAYLRNFNIIPK